jgi:predicted nucleic acid-binding protein
VTLLRVVADSSALIALNDVIMLDRLSPLFEEFLVPRAVEEEIARTVSLRAWMTPVVVSPPIHPLIAAAGLDPGEAEALSLAIERPGHSVLVDERRARRTAKALGLPVIGTVGLVVRAKNDGLIGSIRPILEALVRKRFFLSDSLIEDALRDAGEQDD